MKKDKMNFTPDAVEKPLKRSRLRVKLGFLFYGTKRRILWIKMKKTFAKTFNKESFEYKYFSHHTPMLRKLKDVDMWLQHNKVTNLTLAVKKLDGLVLKPGEVFSYWYLIGKPSKRKGYKKGMILRNGGFTADYGGGLCQLSNLIFWMTVHTPLTVIERYRHGYDVFPDSNRTQPFASGATCAYPHIDLMIRNDTNTAFQLRLNVGTKDLEGEWRGNTPPTCKYEIIEKNHRMVRQFWGGYTRHNELYQQIFDLEGRFMDERLLLKNHAVMMYSPFLPENTPVSFSNEQNDFSDTEDYNSL